MLYCLKTMQIFQFTEFRIVIFPAAPKFLEKLQDVEVTEGKKAVIDCVVTGEPIPDIDWTFEGKPLKESSR